MTIITVSDARLLPPVLATPRHGETAEQAAARLAAQWGVPVVVYAVGQKCPMIFIAKRGEHGNESA